jgi:hypothetical protein
MNTTRQNFRTAWLAQKLGAGMLGVLAMASISYAKSTAPTVGDKPNEISFELVQNPATLDCLRANYDSTKPVSCNP